MQISRFKRMLLALELEDLEGMNSSGRPPSEVTVMADSVQQALNIAAKEMRREMTDLDYQIVQKGGTGWFGIGKIPYQVKVTLMKEDNQYNDIEDMNISLAGAMNSTEFTANEEMQINSDGRALIKIYKTGVFIIIQPPRGEGRPVSAETAIDKVKNAGVLKFDRGRLESAVKEMKNDPVKIGEWVPRPDADSTLAIEISPDQMKVLVTVSRPRPGGRHLQSQDVINAMKAAGVQWGFKDKEIAKFLDDERYGTPFVGAEGTVPIDGKDGYIDYKVRIEKKIEFKEDESGRVDFLSRDLVENVVQGQILAELVPAQRGQDGRTLFNKIISAKNGKSIELKPGKGTILSEDGKKLLAERNGQVVYRAGILTVQETYLVNGDVGLNTGNIMFLGSVVVTGSVQDNMQVKAAGSIEVAGSVQKSHIEAEGDIMVRQGIQGRDGAMIESTSGNVLAKFIQNATVSVEKDVVVAENIMHAKIYAGSRIICNGKRAQIVGGELMAGNEIRVKQLGAQAATPTLVIAGTNPKVLQQIKQIESVEQAAREKLDKVETNIRTLQQMKSTSPDAFTQDKEEQLVKMLTFKEKLNERLEEALGEKNQLAEYLGDISSNGAVHVEKTVFPGVTIQINNATFPVKDEYTAVTFIEESGNIRILPYRPPDEDDEHFQRRRRGGRR